MRLREIIDIAWLEDFAAGLARAARLRVCIYDADRSLVLATAANNLLARLTGRVLGTVPAQLTLTPVPAHDPPGVVAFVSHNGVWYVLAPVYVDDQLAGHVAVGEFRDQPIRVEDWQPQEGPPLDPAEIISAWESLPPLDRAGHSHAVITARWGARMLAEWCRRETRLQTAADEAALVGDTAELLTGEQDLQSILDRIVAETARVMQCPAASMRLYDAATDELTIKAVWNLPQDYLAKGPVLRGASAVDDEALRGGVVYIEDAGRDPRIQHPDEVRRWNIVSILTAGMVYRGTPVGVLRVYTDRRRRFRKAQRSLLHAVAHQAAAAIVHARLVEERLKAVEIERQLALAGDLQARIVRTPPPRHPHLEVALVFQPSYAVAGDFCDFLTLADGRTAAVVGDVVGKGIPASLLMAMVRGALRAGAEYCASPAELLTRLNRQVCRDTRPNEFVTLLLIAFDPDARRLTYCSAGHEPLLVLRGGRILPAADGNLILGAFTEVAFEDRTLALEPGDLLLLYTDGVCEARNFADENFGRERLAESLRQYGHLPPRSVLENLMWDVRRFTGLAEQSDDQTLVAIRVRR